MTLLSENNFKDIYQKEYRSIYAYIFANTHEKKIVKDLCQDVFLKLWNSFESYDSSKPIRPFLFQIAKRVIIDNYRKTKSKSFLSNDEGHLEEFASIQPYSEHNKRVKSCLEEMPIKYREAFVLHHDFGFKYKEIALFFDVSYKTIESWMGKIMKLLREEFTKE